MKRGHWQGSLCQVKKITPSHSAVNANEKRRVIKKENRNQEQGVTQWFNYNIYPTLGKRWVSKHFKSKIIQEKCVDLIKLTNIPKKLKKSIFLESKKPSGYSM